VQYAAWCFLACWEAPSFDSDYSVGDGASPLFFLSGKNALFLFSWDKGTTNEYARNASYNWGFAMHAIDFTRIPRYYWSTQHPSDCQFPPRPEGRRKQNFDVPPLPSLCPNIRFLPYFWLCLPLRLRQLRRLPHAPSA